MKNENTVKVYEQVAIEYIKNTPTETSKPFADFWNRTLEGLNKSDLILEIGSGNGRLARYLESVGWNILRSDVADSFVEHLKKQGETVKLDVMDVKDMTSRFNIIIAEAVLLHFNDEELLTALQNIKYLLNENGVLIATFKRGEGDLVSNHKVGMDRYFNLWEINQLEQICRDAGFVIEESGSGFVNPDSENKKWIYVTLKNVKLTLHLVCFFLDCVSY